MKKLVLLLALLACMYTSAQATDITISAQTLSGFYAQGLPAAVTGTVNTSGTAVTYATGTRFLQQWVNQGYSGFRISINGVDYTVSSVTSTTTLTLSSTAGTQTGVSFTIYPFVLLQVYALQSYIPGGSTQIIQAGAPGSGAFYRQVACSIISNTVYIPSMTLAATTDATGPASTTANLSAWFYNTNGSRIKAFDCLEQFRLPSTPTSTTWAAVCEYNRTNYVPLPTTYYTAAQVNALLNSYYIPSGITANKVVKGNGTTLVDSTITDDGSTVTLTTPLVAPAATTSIPSVRLPHGTAPSSPTNGDVWTTTTGMYARINGTTVGPFGGGVSGGTQNYLAKFGSGGNSVTNSDLDNYTTAGVQMNNLSAAFMANSPLLNLYGKNSSGSGNPQIGLYTGADGGGTLLGTLTGSVLGAVAFGGNTQVGSTGTWVAGAKFSAEAVDNFTSTAVGSLFRFELAPTSSTTLRSAFSIHPDQTVRLYSGSSYGCFRFDGTNMQYSNNCSSYSNIGSGGSGSPGGSTTQMQYNAAGSFGGVSGVTSDGTNMTAGSGNLRATSPRFTTDISDTNGNELLKLTATASAVNELTLANGATGNNPLWTASGGDTNIGISWLAKGSGTFNLTGNSTQAAQLRLYEDTDDGTNYTAFKVGTQAGDVTYTLPTADGSSGQVLSTNGSGTLSWATAGGVSGLTTGIIPYASSSTALADSPMSRVSSSRVDITSGEFRVTSPTGGTSGSFPLRLSSNDTAGTYMQLANTATNGTDYLFVSAGNTYSSFTGGFIAGSPGFVIQRNTTGLWGLDASDNVVQVSHLYIRNNDNTARQIRLYEPSGSGSNYTAFKAQAQSGDVTYTLPAADGTSGYCLSTNGSGTLSWVTCSGGGISGLTTNAVTYGTSGTTIGSVAGVTSDGTNMTAASNNLRATSPRFINGINDTNGNEFFLLTATASAVNQITLANGATGNNPTFTASGDDTNIGITFTPQGTGAITATSQFTVSGRTLNTDADGTIGAQNVTFGVTKNDTNTRTFPGLKIAPTLNTGGTNANTTIDILQIDTTNTATTGLTVNLIDAMYGGSSKFTVTSNGNVGLGTTSFGGTGTTNTVALLNGTTPTAALTDGVLLSAKDYTAGDSRLVVRTENGASETWIGKSSILFGGTTSSYVGWIVGSGYIKARLADDSAYTGIWVGEGNFDSTIFAKAATTSIASLNIPHGTAPTSPTNGDVWTTTAGMYVRINGSTVGPLGTGGGGSPAGSTGDYQINNGGSFGAGVLVQGSNGRLIATPTAVSSGTASYFTVKTPADTALTASTESVGAYFGGNGSGSTVTRQWSTGALTTQRENVFVAPTYAFVGASTLTSTCTVCITAAPVAGTNATITNAYALWTQAGKSRFELTGSASTDVAIEFGKPSLGVFSLAQATNSSYPNFLLSALSNNSLVALAANGAANASSIQLYGNSFSAASDRAHSIIMTIGGTVTTNIGFQVYDANTTGTPFSVTPGNGGVVIGRGSGYASVTPGAQLDTTSGSASRISGLFISASSNSAATLVARAGSSATGDYLQLQNSSSTVAYSFNPNWWQIQKEASSDPTTSNLTAGDHFSLYRKNDKLVIAYNNAGTMTYLTIPLDGSTATWTQSTTAP